MSNRQLIEMVERLNSQFATLTTMAEAAVAANQITAQELADLCNATDLMSQAMDERIQACEGDVEASKKELKEAQKMERESRDRHFRLVDPKTMRPEDDEKRVEVVVEVG